MVPVGGAVALTLRACVAGGPGGAAEAVLTEQHCSLEAILVLRVGEARGEVWLAGLGLQTAAVWLTCQPWHFQLCRLEGRRAANSRTVHDTAHSLA